MLLAIGARLIGWQALREVKSPWNRQAMWLGQIGLGFVLDVAIGLWYVVTTGVDSM